MGLELVFLDLETTGLDPELDKIIEIAAVSVSREGARKTFSCLVDPGIAIPAHITRLTGINDETVRGALYFEDLQSALLELIGDKIIVAHNAAFDISFLKAALGRALPNISLDTVDLARLVFPSLTSYSLRHLTRELGTAGTSTHRALDDVLALEGVFNQLMAQARSLPLRVLREVLELLRQSGQGLVVLWEELLREQIRCYDFRQDLTPAQADFGAGTDTGGRPQSDVKWDFRALEKMFLPGGCVADSMPGYQKRTAQMKMAKAVAKAMDSKRHLLIEAGTGVGKSMAYLVPAILWAVSQKEKVIVATHTIALQEQLFHAEIKLLQNNLNVSFKAAVLKGRGNYLCLDRYRAAQRAAASATSWKESLLLARIAVWLSLNGSGDKDSLNLRSQETELYAQLSSTAESCRGPFCPYLEECFYQKAKQRAQEADVIIINHSLLLADLKIGGAVLPKYQYLIIDEAHHLEEEGARHFSETFSLKEFQRRLSQAQKKNDLFRKSGLLHSWKEYVLAAEKKNDPAVREMYAKVSEAEGCLAKIKNNCNEITEYLSKNPTIETVRIREKNGQNPWWQDLTLLLNNLLSGTADLLDLLTQLQNYPGKKKRWEEGNNNGKEIDDEEQRVQELSFFYNRVGEDYELVKKFLHQKPDETAEVRWVEKESFGKDLRLNITPLRIDRTLHDYLFAAKDSVVLTSATLSVGESFDFLIEQLGIPLELVDTQRVPSPFFYDEQTLMLIDNSLPDPTKTSDEGYGLAVAEALTSFLKVVGGSTLVLFTAHKQLRYVFDLLSEKLRQDGLELYADGINGRRNTLIGELKNNPKAVVFGAGTFWEGIDLPGPALTSLVIVKLPFLPPNLPLAEAKAEELARNGKNGFLHLSLPQAVLKFRQGYGRLIRSNEDCGIVLVLDNRLLSKRYGKSFIHSLPGRHYFTGDTDAVASKIEQWFREMNIARANNGFGS